MSYPSLPPMPTVAEHFRASLRSAQVVDSPYRHWKMQNVLPVDICTGIMTLPIAPPAIPDRDGTRDTYNASRTFFSPDLRRHFPVVAVLCDALQDHSVASALYATFDLRAAEAHLRIEYIQDTDGAWLEPHRDIPDKLFSMVVYLCTGPEAKDWGTDIYDDDRRWIGRAAAEFNSAVTFKAGPNTWHGFDKRPIRGVRRLLEINYVMNWRDRNQLAFPDDPVSRPAAHAHTPHVIA
ncbi:MAG: 2OG-Fe(II) oxygenase [Hyphomicrobiales bacterium]|nr:MAG: 2OG-Fe(II) oxygenase [Hyphomicrobiales bacterium]